MMPKTKLIFLLAMLKIQGKILHRRSAKKLYTKSVNIDTDQQINYSLIKIIAFLYLQPGILLNNQLTDR